MARLYARMFNLLHDDKGATAIEYGLIAALVSVFIIGALQALGGDLTNTFNAIATALTNATPAAGAAP